MLRYLPNVLSGLRLAAAPATVGLLAAGHFNAAFGIFAAAGVSDAVDGYVAKRFGVSTRFGAYLDPAADKAMILAAFVALAALGIVPVWIALVVIARDILIVTGVCVALLSNAPLVIAPLYIGKLSTALQIAYIGVHLAMLAFDWRLDALSPVDAYIVGAVTITSMFAYLRTWTAAMQARLRVK